MGLHFLCNVWGEMINTLRGIPETTKMILYVVSILLILWFLYKGIKVNWNAKDTKKLNFFWFFPILLLVAFIWMLSI